MTKEYKFDLHVHTNTVSICGQVAPEEVTALYAAAGYSGIAITDHFHKEYFDSLGDISWEEKIDCYLDGYRRAKNTPNGLQVLLGLEFRNTQTNDDFLIFGLSEEFLYENPETYLLSREKAFSLFHEAGALVIQAHPCRMRLVQAVDGQMKRDFRDIEMLSQLRKNPKTPIMSWEEGMEIIKEEKLDEFSSPAFLRVCELRSPMDLDGIEVYNGNHHWVQNPLEIEAIMKQYPEFIALSSSDFHEPIHCGRGGIVFSDMPENESDLVNFLKTKRIKRLLKHYE